MRRGARIVGLALAALLVAAPSAFARADLVQIGSSEPPNTVQGGGSFRASFTHLNQGSSRAGKSTLRGFLSTDQARGNDIQLTGSGSVPALAKNRTKTQSANLTVPANTAQAFYYLILCSDATSRVRESNERNNCDVSGQKVGVGLSERGPVGAAGPEGAPGPPGFDAIGPAGTSLRPIARTELDLGRATVDLTQFPLADGQSNNGIPDEGSTQTAQLAQIGPITVTALCRETTNGDEEPPGDSFEAPEDFDEDGDEAKILMTTSSGTFNMSSSRHGERKNIPAGTGTPGDETENGGEGQHQALAVARDPDPNTEATDGPGDNNFGGDTDVSGETDFEFREAFRHASVFVAHSDGTMLIAHVWAGIDVLGVGDRCAFGGAIQVVNLV